MANYSAQNGVDFSREFVKGIPVAAVDFMVADFVQSTIWNFFQWGFSRKQKLKCGSAFIADAAQDLTSAVPTDFYQLLWARLTRTDLTDGNHYKELTVVQRIDPMPPSLKFPFNALEFIAHVPELSAFRLEYPLAIVTDELTQLDIEYQKTPTKITASNITTPFTDIPDWFFPVFTDGVMWRFMVLANDKRQGALQVTRGGGKSYTGQMGVFYNALIDQASSELQSGADLRFPSEGSLGAGRGRGTAFGL